MNAMRAVALGLLRVRGGVSVGMLARLRIRQVFSTSVEVFLA